MAPRRSEAEPGVLKSPYLSRAPPSEASKLYGAAAQRSGAGRAEITLALPSAD
jgi:hypothetical protein